jgi:hypothetical protein
MAADGPTVREFEETRDYLIGSIPRMLENNAGIATFRHVGTNQDGDVVFEGIRRVLLKRRSHWLKR